MDSSKEYVLMCEKAKELQNSWKPAEGDYIYVSNNVELIGYIPKNNPDSIYTTRTLKYNDKPYNKKRHPMIWMPRQDQLWDLIAAGKKLFGEYGVVIDNEQGKFEFVFFSPAGSALHMAYGDTVEQCLLEAYMQLNYHIKWNE